MKVLFCVLAVCLFSSVAMAEVKKGDERMAALWKEMLAEKENYAKMKKQGASEKELELQEKLIKDLYNTVIAMKKDKYGKDVVKKKADGPIEKAWQKVLAAKKEYAAMEKDEASKEELEAKKTEIEDLYKKVVAMKKAKYKK